MVPLALFILPIGIGVILIFATLFWAKFVDQRRQDIDSSFVRIKGVAVTHHIFEFPANVVIGFAMGELSLMLMGVFKINIVELGGIFVTVVILGSVCIWIFSIAPKRVLFGLRDTNKRNAIALIILDSSLIAGLILGLTFPL